MTTTTVLVTGATGRVGRRVADGLLDRGVRVAALVRRRHDDLPADVDRHLGDLEDPATLRAAVRGVDAVFLVWPAMTTGGIRPAVQALTAEGADVVALTAAQLQGVEEGVTPDRFAAVEEAVEATGVGWTFLRGGGFAVNTLGWADQIRAGGPVRIPYPDAGRSLLHEQDLADAAVAALTDRAHRGRAYALTGPETLTQREQVATIGAAIGRELQVQAQDPEQARAELAVVDADFADRSIACWATLVERPERVTDGVRQATGHPARTFAQWASDHAADFRPER